MGTNNLPSNPQLPSVRAGMASSYVVSAGTSVSSESSQVNGASWALCLGL